MNVRAMQSKTALFVAICSFVCQPQKVHSQDKNPGLIELERIRQEYAQKRMEALKPIETKYRTDLEWLGRAAVRQNEGFTAAEIARQIGSPDLPDLVIIDFPPKSKSQPNFTELKHLREEFDRRRDDVDRKLLEWCRTELDGSIRLAMQRSDLASAATLSQSRDSVSKPLLRIVRASYGSGGQRKDVTLVLRKAVDFNRLETRNGKGMGDPAPYRLKDLSVTYLVGGEKEKHTSFGENAVVKLP